MILPGDPHDLDLRRAVAPPDWRNPAPARRYDLVVLGGGTAGLVAAAITAGLGGRVALIEKEMLGGDCLNYGCVPSKALLRAARAAADARRAGEFGLGPASEQEVDFAAVMERMRRLRATLAAHDGAARFAGLGVDVFLGEGRFGGPDRVEVAGRTLRFARALLATGARPSAPPVPGLEEAGYFTNLTLFTLTELPRRLLVVGAGPIGCEMAQAFARFGSQVTLLSLDPRVLPREDPAAAALVAAALARDGVRLELGASLARVERAGAERTIHYRRDGAERRATGDAILVGTGRKPNVEGIGLEDAGIRVGPRGVEVDDRLRTSNRRVYAAGDVAGRWQFTHAADAMARLVVRNAFFFGRGRASALTIPWCTYTSPEVAHVGLYASQADEAGVALEELRIEWPAVDRAVLDGESGGFAKVVIERRSGRLRGATVVAEHAGEILGEMCLAVSQRLPVTRLASVVHPYPTQSSVWSRLGDAGTRRRLTPRVAKLLGAVVRSRR